MARKPAKVPSSPDHRIAARLIREKWKSVTEREGQDPLIAFLEDAALVDVVKASINHSQVVYRYCLPIQVLGKLCDPVLDCLKLQRGKSGDATAWDARSLGSKVVSRFILEQESVLGTSQDPYVGNPMRIPRMVRDDSSKKDVPGWNAMVGLLERIEAENDPTFTESVFCQVLLEILRRQRSLRFTYSIPLRISLEDTLSLMRDFLNEKSGGDRALALAAALFESIGLHFGLFAEVKRGMINTADAAADQLADLECVDAKQKLVMAVEVKDRRLSLSDIEGTLQKAKQRVVSELFFTAPGIDPAESEAVAARGARSFASGQNLYVFDLIDLSRAVLAIGGESIRVTFLTRVGNHLDEWNTQPRHRQAWQQLLGKF